jgi:hypothetical protein
MPGWQVWLLYVIWVVVVALLVPPLHQRLQQRRERREETPAAPAARRRRRRRYGVVALAGLVVALSNTGLHALAATQADRLTVAVHSQPSLLDTTQTVIFSSTLRGASPVEASQAAINETQTRLPRVEFYHCPLGTYQPSYLYDVSFYWQDLLVETAQVATADGCLTWQLHVLGLPNLLIRTDYGRLTALCTLRRLTGMPLPTSWGDPCR